tara:strand:- start:379 stop:2574 length:2196 start_codon:yes stop_codon:yes gene_type:complete
MIKKLLKILSVILLLLSILIVYLSFIGIKTEKFNENIINRVLKINKKIKLDLKNVKFLLDPLTFSANIATKDPLISLGENKLQLRSVKINLSLKSLIFNKFAVDKLQISTKPIALNDLIILVRSFKNSTELFLLNKVIKDGFLVADIKLKFDNAGNLKKDYQINGFIKNGNLNFLNQIKAKNFNFNFNINKNKYSLTALNAEINNVELSSPLIEINEKKKLFFIKGKILSSERNFSRDQLDKMFGNLLKIPSIKKARFDSESEISFDLSKKLKFNNLNIKSNINVAELVIKNNFIDLQSYLPHLGNLINFEKHKINFNYSKDKIDIKGNGKILTKQKFDFIDYHILKDNNKFIFNTKANLKNSKLIIDFLDYEKKENLDASILIKGNIKSNKQINFDIVSLVENNNRISFNNLYIHNNFKFKSLDSFNFNYLNNKKVKNKLLLKKNNSNYIIEGESFDATKLINEIMNSDNENPSLFEDFNSKIVINIKKTFIDEFYFTNNLSGTLIFKNNKIDNLNFKSNFSNDRKINLSITTNNKKEKITNFSTDYPKPLIKRYDFIKGFEEGYLVYQSVKKNGTSKSLLTIDNFKVQEVPVFAKILSLASLQGIADLLTGEGIRFTDFEMSFSNKDGLTTIEEMYAIGPAVSILMDGYIESKTLSLRGTLVPATTINRSIASIPLLGKILIGNKTGEGVFGVSFKIKGHPKNLKTSVNPIKTLTPRFITRTLEKIKKN